MILHKGNSNKKFKDLLDEIEFERVELKEKLDYRENKIGAYEFEGTWIPSAHYFDHLTFQIKRGEDYRRENYTEINYIIQDLIINSFERGEQPVFIKLYQGKNGSILKIRDSGQGFDLEKKLEQMKNGEKYFKRQGCGLKSFQENKNIIFYQGKNNIVNFVYLK
jgi:hypothetical protein